MDDDTKAGGRGGRRTGAGRPPGDGGPRRVRVTVRLSPVELDALDAAADAGEGRAAAAARIIRAGLAWRMDRNDGGGSVPPENN